MPVLSKGGDELFLGAKRDKVVYGAPVSSKTSLVEALTSQSSKTSELVVITDSVEPAGCGRCRSQSPSTMYVQRFLPAKRAFIFTGQNCIGFPA
jgi:hypothetical protein